MQHELNNFILSQVKHIRYIPNDIAPNTERGLFNASSLVIWTGESDTTIFRDASVNWAFRAWHDSLHLKTRLDFSVDAEIELGRIQASQCYNQFADLIYAEVAGQAMHYKLTGLFVSNQIEFAKQYLTKIGVNYAKRI
jgi:hypothetical protein